MADLQRDETLTRRSLILAAISSAQKETLDVAKADERLFGQKLGDRLKAAKSIELKVRERPEVKAERHQSIKKDWGNQGGGDRNISQSQMSTYQKKS